MNRPRDTHWVADLVLVEDGTDGRPAIVHDRLGVYPDYKAAAAHALEMVPLTGAAGFEVRLERVAP